MNHEETKKEILAEHHPLADYLRDSKANAYVFYAGNVPDTFVVFGARSSVREIVREDLLTLEMTSRFPHVAVFSADGEWSARIDEVVDNIADREKLRASIWLWLEEDIRAMGESLKEMAQNLTSLRGDLVGYNNLLLKAGRVTLRETAA